MICVGTMIGAGYASGQEVVAYFGPHPSVAVPAVCGALMFVFTAVLLGIGSCTSGDLADVNRTLFGRAGGAADVIMLANAVIVLSAMMAGTDSALEAMTGTELPYGVALCLAGIYVVRQGGGGLAKANTVLVPCIAVTLGAVCLNAGLDLTGAFSLTELPLGFAYVSMNLLLGAGVLVTRRGMTAGQVIAASGISAVTIAGLLTLICGALPFAPAGVMPLMELSSGSRVIYALYTLCLLCSIFTTMIGALSTVRDRFASKGAGGEGMLAAALIGSLLSVFGFDKLVGRLYPLIGIIGGAYLIRCAAFLFTRIKFFRKRDRAVHERGESAQCDRCGHNEIGIENLTSVYDKISETRSGYEVFAHDRTHPAESDIDLKHGQKGGNGGGQNGIAQKL